MAWCVSRRWNGSDRAGWKPGLVSLGRLTYRGIGGLIHFVDIAGRQAV